MRTWALLVRLVKFTTFYKVYNQLSGFLSDDFTNPLLLENQIFLVIFQANLLQYSQTYSRIFLETEGEYRVKNEKSSIPRATAKRLSLYYRIFKRFNAENIEKASSKEIAEAIGIDAATVRRDFSYFGELGRRGFGYDVKKLMEFFADILNDNSITNVMLVGVGNMGRALLHYRFHERNKMKIVMAFEADENPAVGTVDAGIPIYAISEIEEKIKEAKSQTAILTVPSNKAQEVANILVAAGVKGILSFSPVNLSVPKDVVVQYVDLTSELQTLLYFMRKD